MGNLDYKEYIKHKNYNDYMQYVFQDTKDIFLLMGDLRLDLIDCVKYGNLIIFKRLLEMYNNIMIFKNYDYYNNLEYNIIIDSVLFTCCEYNNVEILKYIIEDLKYKVSNNLKKHKLISSIILNKKLNKELNYNKIEKKLNKI